MEQSGGSKREAAAGDVQVAVAAGDSTDQLSQAEQIDKQEAQSEGNEKKTATKVERTAAKSVNSGDQLPQAYKVDKKETQPGSNEEVTNVGRDAAAAVNPGDSLRIVEKDAQPEGNEREEATDGKQAAVEAVSSTNQPSQAEKTEEKEAQLGDSEREDAINGRQVAVELLNLSAQLPQTGAQDGGGSETESKKGNEAERNYYCSLLMAGQPRKWFFVKETKALILVDVYELQTGFDKVYHDMRLEARDLNETQHIDADQIIREFTTVLMRQGLERLARRLATFGELLERQVEILSDPDPEANYLLCHFLYPLQRANEVVMDRYMLLHKLAYVLYEQHLSSKMCTKSRQEQGKESAVDQSEDPSQKEAEQEHNAVEKDGQANEEVQENEAKGEDETSIEFLYGFVMEMAINLCKFFSKCAATKEAVYQIEAEDEQDESIEAVVGGEDQKKSDPEATVSCRVCKLEPEMIQTTTEEGVKLLMADEKDVLDRLKHAVAEEIAKKVYQTREQQAQQLNVGSEKPSKPDDVAQESAIPKAQEVDEVVEAAETIPEKPGMGLGQQAQQFDVGSEEPSEPDDVAQESAIPKAQEVDEVPRAAETIPEKPDMGLDQQAQQFDVGPEEPSEPDDVAQESEIPRAQEVEEVLKAAETTPEKPSMGL